MIINKVQVGDVWQIGNVKRKVLILFKINGEMYVGYMFQSTPKIKGCVDCALEEFLSQAELVYPESRSKKGKSR